MMQNEEGQYGNAACTLRYEGHMLVYNLQKDVSEWVPIRGISALLTSSELRSANNLNNINLYPHNGWGLMEPHSPRLVQGIPMGEEEESDMDSYVEPSDSGEEWDKAKHSDWSCCPAPPLGKKVTPEWKPQLKLHREKSSQMNKLPLGMKWPATLHERRSPLIGKTQTGMVTPVHQWSHSLRLLHGHNGRTHSGFTTGREYCRSFSRAGKSGHGANPCGEWWPRLGVSLHVKHTKEDRVQGHAWADNLD